MERIFKRVPCVQFHFSTIDPTQADDLSRLATIHKSNVVDDPGLGRKRDDAQLVVVEVSGSFEQELDLDRLKRKDNAAAFGAINNACIEQRGDIGMNRFDITFDAARSGFPVFHDRAKFAIDASGERTSRMTVFIVPPRYVFLKIGC